jgi:UDP-N-acetylglucosamine 2-epimerase (non-hydrolysing)
MDLHHRSILLIAGTRPELIKLAPLLLYAKEKNRAKLRVQLCVTGQHETMANEALAIFGLNADHNLKIMKENQTPNGVSAAVFERLPFIFDEIRPDLVMVQGDTTSAAAAALCAFNSRIPVAHVEAGLRSHDLTAPFPEEMNRKVITATAQINFCPTEMAKQNLLRESIPSESIVVTGNTIVDALRIIGERNEMNDVTVVDHSIRTPFVLVTAHRRESFGEGIKNVCGAIKECARRFPDHQFVYPVHLNPNINEPVRQLLGGIQNILLLPPISYLNLLTLLKNCELVLSDSGGIQEEAPSFGKYCIVLRNVTERQESVDLGLSELVGTDPERIVEALTRKIRTRFAYPSLSNPYGDGHAADRILETLASYQALP